MVKFEITLDVNENILAIDGPSDLKVREKIYSTKDIYNVFKTYLSDFCNTIHYCDYRIDKIKNRYNLSKKSKDNSRLWKFVDEFDNYFAAFEAICEAEYEKLSQLLDLEGNNVL